MLKYNNHIFLSLFLVFCSFGTLKIYISAEIYWGILLIFFSLFLYSSFLSNTTMYTWRLIITTQYPWIIGWFFLIIGIIISDFINNQNNIISIIKYTLIMLLVIFSLKYCYIDVRVVEKALYISLLCNVILLCIIILFKMQGLLIILGDGRIGWLANWPGKLWYVAAFVYPLAFFRILTTSNKKIWFYLMSALLLFSLDGSRTGFLWLALTTVASILICLGQSDKKIIFVKLLLLLLAVYVMFFVIQPSIEPWIVGVHTLGETSEPVLSRVVEGDTQTRLMMLNMAYSSAIKNFPFGASFGATMSQESDGTPVVIHMAYLQVLSDLGVIGFIGLLCIVFYPLYKISVYLLGNISKNILYEIDQYILPLSIILLFSMTLLLHPMSNELTEWGVVIIAMAILLQKNFAKNE